MTEYMNAETIKTIEKLLVTKIENVSSQMQTNNKETKEGIKNLNDQMQSVLSKIQEIETKNNMLSNLFANNKFFIISFLFFAFLTGNERLIDFFLRFWSN